MSGRVGAASKNSEMAPVDRAMKRWVAALGLSLGVLAADQASKALVDSLLVRGQREELLSFLAIENTRNSGIAFGLGGDLSTVVIAGTVVVLVFMLGAFAKHSHRRGAPLAAGLLVGGALGNLADRIRQGSVTDFISLPHWPTFNLADIAITLGVALLVLLTLRSVEEAPR